MATHFNGDCPHCQTRGAGFAVAYQWAVRGSAQKSNLLALCGICNYGVTLRISYKRGGQFPNLLQSSVSFPGVDYSIDKSWPSYNSETPTGVPDNVSSFYLQGLENLHHRRWDAAGAMFRKTIDTGTKLIDSELKSHSLFSRINKLVEKGLLTPAMGDWSHEIRLDGNSAVHDEDPETEQDATRAQKFTEAFLNYAFALPDLVATSRSTRPALAAE
jgi:hypothetical protein